MSASAWRLRSVRLVTYSLAARLALGNILRLLSLALSRRPAVETAAAMDGDDANVHYSVMRYPFPP